MAQRPANQKANRCPRRSLERSRLAVARSKRAYASLEAEASAAKLEQVDPHVAGSLYLHALGLAEGHRRATLLAKAHRAFAKHPSGSP